MPGKFVLICGPMFAGKTTELRRQAENHARCNLRVLLIRPRGDDRGCEEKCDDGRLTPALFTHRGDWGIDEKLSPLFRTVRAERLGDVEPSDGEEFIAVDEGQFFPDLAARAREWADSGKTVVVTALNGKSDRTPWPAISAAFAEVDECTYLSAICGRCKRPEKRAIFSMRLPGAMEADAEGKAVGGAESYTSVCRQCALDDGRVPDPETA